MQNNHMFERLTRVCANQLEYEGDSRVIVIIVTACISIRDRSQQSAAVIVQSRRGGVLVLHRQRLSFAVELVSICHIERSSL